MTLLTLPSERWTDIQEGIEWHKLSAGPLHKTIRELAAEVIAQAAALSASRDRVTALEQGLRAIGAATRDDAKGEFWTARQWLDDHDVYHGDLSGKRVIYEVVKALLPPAPEAQTQETR